MRKRPAPMKTLPHIGRIPQSERDWFDALVALARYLRGPNGCPWDRKQTSSNFARFAREEAEELAQACAAGADDEIEEEWGDTLFTLLAAAAAAESEGRFALIHALERAHAKMVRRHGHIFGEHTAKTPEDAAAVWNRIKAREKAGKRPSGRRRK